MTSVINRLSTSLGRRDETPNQELANQIVSNTDKKAVEELIQLLKNHKDKSIQNDCIKVLYEVGEQNPKLIAIYIQDFADLLDSKNNRLVWGAMTALDTITVSNPESVVKLLPLILDTVEKGSVITNDRAVGIFIKLASHDKYAESAFPLLFEQLLICPTKQLPMYAERAFVVVNESQKSRFMEILFERIEECDKQSEKKRISKVLMKATRI